MNKYEQLIEHIINDNEKAAKEIFHQIVVEKSRDIYESIMDEELGGNQAQGFVQDISQQDSAASDQGLGEDDEEMGEIELGGDDDMGDEETFGGDMDDMDSEQGEHGEIESKIDELSAQLEELKAMLAGEEPGMDDMDDMGSDDMGGEEHSDFDSDEHSDFDAEPAMGESANKGIDKEVKKAAAQDMGKNPFASGSGKSGSGKSGSGVKESYRGSEVEIMKEYVNKIADVYNSNMTSEKGAVVGDGGGQHEGKGTTSDDHPAVNSKGVVRQKNLSKFDGETAGNIVNGGAEQAPDGKPIEKPKNEYSKGEKEQPLATRDGGYKNQIGGTKTAWKDKNSRQPEQKDTEKGRLVGAEGTRPINKDSIIDSKKGGVR